MVCVICKTCSTIEHFLVDEDFNPVLDHIYIYMKAKTVLYIQQLDVEQAANYDIVKELILKGYELVPEAYRQKFRSFEKLGCQT